MPTPTSPQPFTQAQLEAAFDLLADPDDWKAPIAAWVSGESVRIAVAAIQHFTATDPTVELDTFNMRYLISSVGYRAGPAGDH